MDAEFQRARVEPVRIECHHPREQLRLVSGIGVEDFAEVFDVLLGCGKMPHAVDFLGLPVTGDDVDRVEFLYQLDRPDPLVALRPRVGFHQHLMDLAVDDIAADGKSQIGNPQHSRVVGVAVAAFNGTENPTVSQLEFEIPLRGDGLGEDEWSVDLAGKECIPYLTERFLGDLLIHVFEGSLSSQGNSIRKALDEKGDAEEVVTMAMGDIL